MPAKPPPPPVDCRIGKGNSPPARKLASLPDSVIRLGSARISSTFCSCRALIVAARLMSGRKMKMLSKSLRPIALPVVGVVPTPFALVSWGGANCWVEMVPMFLAPGQTQNVDSELADGRAVDLREPHLQQDFAGGRCRHLHQAGDLRGRALHNFENLVGNRRGRNLSRTASRRLAKYRGAHLRIGKTS